MVQGTGPCCIALLPAVVATLAIASSILSTVWCETIEFPPDLSSLSNSNTGEFLNSTSEQTQNVLSNKDGYATFQFGLYYYSQITDIQLNSAGDTITKVTDTCVEYGDEVNFDAAWKTARAFALIAPIAGGFFAVGLYLSPCYIFYNRSTWYSIACLFMLVIPAFQSLTLLFLTSDACKDNPIIESRLNEAIQALSSGGFMDDTTTTSEGNTTMTGDDTASTGGGNIGSDQEVALRSIYANDCEWSWGMYANIVSMCLFFLTGVVMILMQAPTRPPPKEPEIHTVTYERKVGDDGQITIEQVDVQVTGGDKPSWANTDHQPLPDYNNNEMEVAKPY